MPINKHTQFAPQVVQEFQRRMNDFGVKLENTQNVNPENFLLDPVDLDSSEFRNFSGGRSVWVRVASGGIGYGSDSSVVSVVNRKNNTISTVPVVGSTVYNGIILTSDLDRNKAIGDSKVQVLGNTVDILNSRDGYFNTAFEVTTDSDRMRPSPVIESMNVKYRNSLGTILEADFTWKAFTQSQFETLSSFFCQLKRTVVLEWGWSSFNGQFVDLTDVNLVKLLQMAQPVSDIKSRINSLRSSNPEGNLGSIKLDQFTEDFNEVSGDSLNPRQKRILQQGIDYSVFVGIITNFDVSLSDGVYTVTTNLMTAGDALSGLSVDRLFGDYFSKGGFDNDVRLGYDKGDARVWFKEPKEVQEESTTEPSTSTEDDKDLVDEQVKLIQSKELRIYDPSSSDTKGALDALWSQSTTGPLVLKGFDFAPYRNKGYSLEFIQKLLLVKDWQLKRALIRTAYLTPDAPYIDAPRGSDAWNLLKSLSSTGVLGPVAWALSALDSDEPPGISFSEAVVVRRWLRDVIKQRIGNSTVLSNSEDDNRIFSSSTGKNTWWFFKTDDIQSSDAFKGKDVKLIDKNVDSFLDEHLDTIRFALESELQRGQSVTPPTPENEEAWTRATSRTNTYSGPSSANSSNTKATELIQTHLSTLSYGIAYTDIITIYQVAWDNFPGTGVSQWEKSRIEYDSNDISHGARLINMHLNEFKPNYKNSPFSFKFGATSDEIIPKQAFSFITFGLLEEIINAKIGVNNIFTGLKSESTQVSFRQNLISTDSDVCIIPNSSAPQFEEGVLLPDRVDLSIQGISEKVYVLPDGSTSPTALDGKMWLHSIFINVEHIKRIFRTAGTLKSAIENLLSYVNGVCCDLFSFDVNITGSEITIQEKTSIDDAFDDTDDIFIFPYNRAGSFLRNVNASISHTSDTAAAAVLGGGSVLFKNSRTYSSILPLISDTEYDLFTIGIDEDSFAAEDDETKLIDKGLEDSREVISKFDSDNFWYENSSGKLVNYVYPDEEIVKEALFGNAATSEKPTNAGTVPPGISLSIEIDGISGIKPWDVFNVNYLPSFFAAGGYFYVTGVDHSVTNGDWSTTINAQYRISNKDNANVRTNVSGETVNRVQNSINNLSNQQNPFEII